MVTVQSFRQMALSLPRVVELPHFERTSFRVNLPGSQKGKRIIATLDEKKKIAVLMLSPHEQSVFCAFDKTNHLPALPAGRSTPNPAPGAGRVVPFLNWLRSGSPCCRMHCR